MRVHYTPKSAETYVACLRGSGMPFYQGSLHQRGTGIGGFFAPLLRAATMPILKSVTRGMARRAAKKVAKKVARGAMKAAVGVAVDRMRGVPLKEAAKRRLSTAGADVLESMVAPPGRRRYIKRKAQGARGTRVKRRKRSTSGANDIFS